MRPLSPADIRPPSVYEPVRQDARRRVIELKRPRRVAVGSLLTLMFENRETVRGVIEELLRAERIEEPQRIAEEIATFNELIPGTGELSATLFLEITDQGELAHRLHELIGIEDHVHLEIGGTRVGRRAEEGRAREDRTSSVHYLRFHLDDSQRAAFLSGGFEVALAADHPHYTERTVLDERQRMALAEDLLGH